MKFLKSQTSLSMEELEANDIIHIKDEPSFEGYTPESSPEYINNFLSKNELTTLRKFYFNNFSKLGIVVNGTYCMLTDPFSRSDFLKNLKTKIKNLFKEDVFFYDDISSDPIPVGDHFYLLTKAYFPHTDAITHIPGYIPFKDIIVPIDFDGDVTPQYYTCHQRYYRRATHFKYGYKSGYFANYANIIKNTKYSAYGVQNISQKKFDRSFFEKKIKASGLPYSVFNELSIDSVFDWVPGNIIIHDQSVIHGPTSIKSVGCSWKLGLTIHLLKKEPSFKARTACGYTQFSPYTLPLQESKYEKIDKHVIPFHLFRK